LHYLKQRKGNNYVWQKTYEKSNKEKTNEEEILMAKGVPHYLPSGRLYTGKTHKHNGRLMSGATHTASSKYLTHRKPKAK